jgi:hypothetical protein
MEITTNGEEMSIVETPIGKITKVPSLVLAFPKGVLGLNFLKVQGPIKPSIHALNLKKRINCATVCQVIGITAWPHARA